MYRFKLFSEKYKPFLLSNEQVSRKLSLVNTIFSIFDEKVITHHRMTMSSPR